MKKAIGIIAIMLVITGIIFFMDKKQSDNKGFNVTTSFYPIYIATLNITEDANNVNVKNLTKETTGCLHDYSLSPEELVSLSDCDALVINGAGMEGFLDKVISNYSNLNIVDSSEDISLQKSISGETEYNPHIFASVENYIKQVQNISERLIKLNPENKDIYVKNTENYVSELTILKEEMNKAILDIKTKEIITFHEAFTYFASEFGLNVVATIEREPGTDPSAKELAETIDLIKQRNIKVIFVEPGYNAKVAETIANETGTKIYNLDPAASGIVSKDAYINIMRKNLNVIKEALS